MPLVLLSIAGMGILYSLLPDDMTARVIPAEVLEIYESPRMEFELPGRGRGRRRGSLDRSKILIHYTTPSVGA